MHEHGSKLHKETGENKMARSEGLNRMMLAIAYQRRERKAQASSHQ
jgi:hypothetical protein